MPGVDERRSEHLALQAGQLMRKALRFRLLHVREIVVVNLTPMATRTPRPILWVMQLRLR